MVDPVRVASHCQSLVRKASLQNQYRARVKALVTSKELIPKWKNNNQILATVIITGFFAKRTEIDHCPNFQNVRVKKE